MDEFSTSRPAHLRNEGGGFWGLGVVLVIVLLVIAIIGLGSTGGPATGPDGAAAPAVETAPAADPAPAVTE